MEKNDGDDSIGNIKDSLNSTQFIELSAGRYKSGTDINAGAPAAAADIKSWSIQIY